MPSELVRRTAGTILEMLSDGPATAFDIERRTLQDNRTVCRAIRAIETWDVGLKLDRPPSPTKGSNPIVYSLAIGDRDTISQAMRHVSSGYVSPSVFVAIGLAIERVEQHGR